MMSMYSELLAMSLTVDGDAVVKSPPSEKRLLEELAALRERLKFNWPASSSASPDASSRIATEIQYDRTLIKLCRLHAIPCDVERFTLPTRERQRLEGELAAAGVDVVAARARRTLRAAVGHDPPDGS